MWKYIIKQKLINNIHKLYKKGLSPHRSSCQVHLEKLLQQMSKLLQIFPEQQ